MRNRDKAEPISQERWIKYLNDRTQQILQKPSPNQSHYQELHIYYTDFDKLSEQDQEKFITFYYQTSVSKCLATFSNHFLNLISQQEPARTGEQYPAISPQQKNIIFKKLLDDIQQFLSGLTENLTRHSDSLSVKDSEIFINIDIEPESRNEQQKTLEQGFQEAMENAVAAFNLHDTRENPAIDLKTIAARYRQVCCIKLQDIFAKVLTTNNLDELKSQLTRLKQRHEKNIDYINNDEDGKTVNKRATLSNQSKNSHTQGGQLIGLSSPFTTASSGKDTQFMSAGTAEKIRPGDLVKVASITLGIDHPLDVTKNDQTRTKTTPLQLALSSQSLNPVEKAYKLAWAIYHGATIDDCTEQQLTEIESCFATAKAYATLSEKVDTAFAAVLQHVNQQLVKHNGAHGTLDKKLQYITTTMNNIKRGENVITNLKLLRKAIKHEHSGKKTLELVRDISAEYLNEILPANTQDIPATLMESAASRQTVRTARKLTDLFVESDENPTARSRQNSIISDAHFIYRNSNNTGNTKNLRVRKLLVQELLGTLKQYLKDQKNACETPEQKQQAQEKINEVERFEYRLINDGTENLANSFKQLANSKILGYKRKSDLRCCYNFFTTSQRLALQSAKKYAADEKRYKALLVKT